MGHRNRCCALPSPGDHDCCDLSGKRASLLFYRHHCRHAPLLVHLRWHFLFSGWEHPFLRPAVFVFHCSSGNSAGLLTRGGVICAFGWSDLALLRIAFTTGCRRREDFPVLLRRRLVSSLSSSSTRLGDKPSPLYLLPSDALVASTLGAPASCRLMACFN